jgi:signal transduction histidine kinase
VRFHGRLLLAHFVLLLLTILGAWAVVGGGVLHALIGNLIEERADIAVYIAQQVESAGDPVAEVVELAAALQVEIRLVPEEPPAPRRRGRPTRTIERAGRQIRLAHGPRSPMLIPVTVRGEAKWLVVRFPVDLEAPPRRAGGGLIVLAGIALLGAFIAARWTLRPLQTASDAMQRIAAGDLSHRLPEGGDVTGQMGQTFNRMAARVEGLVEDQRQLMAAVSHELRTPLARMRLQLELLSDTGADPGRIREIEGEITEVDGLVEELLESARLDQGVLALRLEAVDLLDLAAEALGGVDLGDRPVDLSIPDGCQITADRRRLLRCLTNLLSNAARYTPPEAEVSLSAATEGDGVRLTVADRGEGVSPEALPRLFDPFFRAEASRSRVTGGLGLGLMLVRQIIEAHGGRIQAENRAGGGLSVGLWLPLTPPRSTPESPP